MGKVSFMFYLVRLHKQDMICGILPNHISEATSKFFFALVECAVQGVSSCSAPYKMLIPTACAICAHQNFQAKSKIYVIVVHMKLDTCKRYFFFLVKTVTSFIAHRSISD